MIYNDFYVYAHKRPNDERIFYVGKGRARRAFKSIGRNLHWNNIVKKNGFVVFFLEENLTEKEAFSREASWIIKMKNLGQCEANYTLGGGGSPGYRFTPEQRAYQSKILKSQTPLMRQGQKNRSLKLLGRNKRTHSGILSQSTKILGTGNGRAIWDIQTPKGIFSTIKEAALAFSVSTAAIHKYLDSPSAKYAVWQRIEKVKKSIEKS